MNQLEGISIMGY